MYDAVNGIDGGHEPYLEGFRRLRPRFPGRCGRDCSPRHPRRRPEPDSADDGVHVSRPAGDHHRINGPTGSCKFDRGSDSGRRRARSRCRHPPGSSRAAAMLAAGPPVHSRRRWPLSDRTFMFTPGPDRANGGLRTRAPPNNDPFAWVAKVKPYIVESNEQFLSKGPHELTRALTPRSTTRSRSSARLGIQRTAEQQAIVDFFQPNPMEMYVRRFRGLAYGGGARPRRAGTVPRTALAAVADTAITCWKDKAHWSFWRPQTAIRLGDDDGNPKTAGDPSWISASSLIRRTRITHRATTAWPDRRPRSRSSYFGHGRTTFTLSMRHPGHHGTCRLGRTSTSVTCATTPSTLASTRESISARQTRRASRSVVMSRAGWASTRCERAK